MGPKRKNEQIKNDLQTDDLPTQTKNSRRSSPTPAKPKDDISLTVDDERRRAREWAAEYSRSTASPIPAKPAAKPIGNSSTIEEERRRAREWAEEHLMSPAPQSLDKPKAKPKPQQKKTTKTTKAKKARIISQEEKLEEEIQQNISQEELSQHIPQEEKMEEEISHDINIELETSLPPNVEIPIDIEPTVITREEQCQNIEPTFISRIPSPHKPPLQSGDRLTTEEQRLRAQEWARTNLHLSISQPLQAEIIASPKIEEIQPISQIPHITTPGLSEPPFAFPTAPGIPGIKSTQQNSRSVSRRRGFTPETALKVVLTFIAITIIYYIHSWNADAAYISISCILFVMIVKRLVGYIFAVPKPISNIQPPTPKSQEKKTRLNNDKLEDTPKKSSSSKWGFKPETALKVVTTAIALAIIYFIYTWSKDAAYIAIACWLLLMIVKRLMCAIFAVPKPVANIQPPTPKSQEKSKN